MLHPPCGFFDPRMLFHSCKPNIWEYQWPLPSTCDDLQPVDTGSPAHDLVLRRTLLTPGRTPLSKMVCPKKGRFLLPTITLEANLVITIICILRIWNIFCDSQVSCLANLTRSPHKNIDRMFLCFQCLPGFITNRWSTHKRRSNVNTIEAILVVLRSV